MSDNIELRKRLMTELGYKSAKSANGLHWRLVTPEGKRLYAGMTEDRAWIGYGMWDTSVDAALTLPLRDGDTWDIWQTELPYDSGIAWNAMIRDREDEPVGNAMAIAFGKLSEAMCECWLKYREGVK